MANIVHLFRMAIRTYHYEGIKGVIKRTLYRLHLIPAYGITKNFKDVLFINGCALPHPARYGWRTKCSSWNSWDFPVTLSFIRI